MAFRKKSVGVLFLVALLVLGWIIFHKKAERSVTYAHYWWNSRFNPNAEQISKLNESSALYLHVFDLDAQPGGLPKPMAELRNYTHTKGTKLIPVVYITQRTLKQMQPSDDGQLSKKILNYTEQILGIKHNNWAGFQIDCDWTESTQVRYFQFLKKLKAEMKGLQLSATIRLHQIKFHEKTGVPPIDRGMLMLYNAGKIEQLQRKNSIFEPSDIQPYLGRLGEYPLPLDYALPAFSWGMVYRMGKLVEILPETAADSACASSHFNKADINLFECKQSGFYHGFYFLKGDRIKYESVDAERCKQAAELLLPYIKNDTFTIAFYQLGSPTFMRYDQHNLEKIRHLFN
jgi:hypothetical protein